MIYIGNHVSFSKGYAAMGLHEKVLGGNTFAFFTRNPRGGKTKDIDRADIDALNKLLRNEKFGPLVAHAPYTMNLCSSKPEIREYSKRVFQEDLARIEMLPGNCLNFHPGSHTGLGTEKGIEIIADVLNETLRPDQSTTVLLETMAGKGTEIGKTFGELKAILDLVRADVQCHLGVCLDTCHIWDAGYDIVNDLDGVLNHFDEVIGIERLYAVHLNDSKNPCGSHKDRHEKIGKGCIGKEALMKVVTHPVLQGKPFILETPNDDDGYKAEIAMVKEDAQRSKEAMNSIYHRISVRKYEDKAVEKEKIMEILKAGMQAPSAGNQQPWEFYVVTDKNKIQQLSKCSSYAGCAANAPVVIVPVYKKEGVRFPGMVLEDMSIAQENMWLMTDSLGLGGVWLGIAPVPDRMENVKKVLNLPDNLEAFSLFPVGYPAESRPQQDRFDESRIHFVQ